MPIEVENTFHAPIGHIGEMIWGWEIPVYLFIGGLVAGLMILSGYYYLKGKREDYPFTVLGGMALAPVLLSLGMLMLFLDLDYKVHVWRFYTAFELTSPMSWGAWILILIYPACILFIAALAREKKPDLGSLNHAGEKLWDVLNSFRAARVLLESVSSWAGERIRFLAYSNIGLGIGLGAYTGILLSSYAARPLWNSQALAPLFLVSGLSSAAALSVMLEKKPKAKHEMARMDRVFIGMELAIIFLIFANLAYSIRSHQWALEPFVGNALYTPMFWILVVGLGLILPLVLEFLEVKKVIRRTIFVPGLVILGGVFLRFVFVYAGQVVCWCYYILR
jgi:protein NrfD